MKKLFYTLLIGAAIFSPYNKKIAQERVFENEVKNHAEMSFSVLLTMVLNKTKAYIDLLEKENDTTLNTDVLKTVKLNNGIDTPGSAYS